MRIKWTTLYVDDQEKALQFYTDKLGFQKKADFSQGNYRWLTVASPEDPEGVELLLESNANPAGKAYQEALHGQGQPASQSLVSDVQAEHDSIGRQGREVHQAGHVHDGLYHRGAGRYLRQLDPAHAAHLGLGAKEDGFLHQPLRQLLADSMTSQGAASMPSLAVRLTTRRSR